jgi:hypothetical protein
MKEVLELVPEALNFCKKASVTEDFPVDSKDSTMASYLTSQYLTKIAGKPVDLETLDLIYKAASLWGIKKEAEMLSQKMEEQYTLDKQALMATKVAPEDFSYVQSWFSGMLSGIAVDLEKVAASAEDLMDIYDPAYGYELRDEVKLYAGDGILNKSAAVPTLNLRYELTGNEEYKKLASFLEKTDTSSLSVGDNRSICKLVTSLDKKANLQVKGFDFYKEAMVLIKDAGTILTIKLNGKEVPYEKIVKLGKDRLKNAVGKEVVDEIGDCPVTTKQVLETLPLDSQRVLFTYLQNV